MSEGARQALWLGLQVAAGASAVVLPPALALAWVLARTSFRGKSVVETVVALPLVLPPTAVGFALLWLFARDGPLGARTLGVDLDVLLTWRGAVLASAVMSFPLVVRTARVAFEEVEPRLEAMARTLGAGPVRAFIEVTLPLARRGLLAAAVLGFTRALGEFGATIIVAGSIPGRTQTLALRIFHDIQTGREGEAMLLAGLAGAIAFAALWTVEALLRRGPGRHARGQP